MCRFHTTTFIVLFLQITIASSMADEVDYLTQIKPLLAEKCYSCHGVLKQESELRLETKSLMLEGGDSGGVIVPGDPEESLYSSGSRPRTNTSGCRPRRKAPHSCRTRSRWFGTWITARCNGCGRTAPTSPSEHWAFQKIERPTIPTTPRIHNWTTRSTHCSKRSARSSACERNRKPLDQF